MTAPAIAEPAGPRRNAGAIFRIGLKLAALLGWLTFCLVMDRAARIAGITNRWPPRFLKGFGWLSGLRATVAGTLPGGSTLILANHLSWLDIAALAGECNAVFVAHDGLAGHPALKFLCQLNDTVFIARHRRGTVSDQIDDMQKAIGRGRPLVLFPEGTTSDGTGLLNFKSSLLSVAEKLDPPPHVVPVALDYRPEAAEIAWVGDEPGPRNFFDILARRRPVRLTVRILPPLDREAAHDRKRMASAAQRAIAGALGEADGGEAKQTLQLPA